MRIGIDLGGTKIEIIALDPNGAALARRRVPTPAGDYPATIEAIGGLVESVERELGCRSSVGIATPGALSRATGRMKNANSTALNGRRLGADLEARLGRDVRLRNDADCFALSEAADGAAAGSDVVFGVILGTGVGGGLVVAGRSLEGANAIAGEWGHNPLPWPRDGELPGPACYCGKHACIETFLSGPGFAARFEERTARRIGAREIAVAAASGDVDASAAFALYEDWLARALATVINVVDPDVVVLGGGISNVARLYTNVPPLLRSYVFSDRVDTRLVPAMHGDSSGVRGAAWLWPVDS